MANNVIHLPTVTSTLDSTLRNVNAVGDSVQTTVADVTFHFNGARKIKCADFKAFVGVDDASSEKWQDIAYDCHVTTTATADGASSAVGYDPGADGLKFVYVDGGIRWTKYNLNQTWKYILSLVQGHMNSNQAWKQKVASSLYPAPYYDYHFPAGLLIVSSLANGIFHISDTPGSDYTVIKSLAQSADAFNPGDIVCKRIVCKSAPDAEGLVVDVIVTLA